MAFNNASKSKGTFSKVSLLSKHSATAETTARTISGTLQFSQMEEEVESHSFTLAYEVKLTPFCFFVGLAPESVMAQCPGYFSEISPPPDYIS